jgi:hypothetical protein
VKPPERNIHAMTMVKRHARPNNHPNVDAPMHAPTHPLPFPQFLRQKKTKIYLAVKRPSSKPSSIHLKN